jgi:hypothetical protein
MDKKFRDSIVNCVHELKGDLFHGEYRVIYVFEDEEIIRENMDLSAEIFTDPNYLSAKLTIYNPLYNMWQHKDYKGVLRILVHELCHLLTEPLYRFSNDHISEVEAKHLCDTRERQTQRIANIAYRALNKKEYFKILKNG